MKKTELSIAFTSFAKEFIDSARSDAELELLALVATAAWNAAVQDDSSTESIVRTFVDRFDCPEIVICGERVDTREKILQLVEQKRQLWPGARVIIRGLDFQDSTEGLQFEVTEFDPV
jgi:hypothetical protein